MCVYMHLAFPTIRETSSRDLRGMLLFLSMCFLRLLAVFVAGLLYARAGAVADIIDDIVDLVGDTRAARAAAPQPPAARRLTSPREGERERERDESHKPGFL